MKFRIVATLLFILILLGWFIQFNYDEEPKKPVTGSVKQSNPSPSRNENAIRNLNLN